MNAGIIVARKVRVTNETVQPEVVVVDKSDAETATEQQTRTRRRRNNTERNTEKDVQETVAVETITNATTTTPVVEALAVTPVAEPLPTTTLEATAAVSSEPAQLRLLKMQRQKVLQTQTPL